MNNHGTTLIDVTCSYTLLIIEEGANFVMIGFHGPSEQWHRVIKFASSMDMTHIAENLSVRDEQLFHTPIEFIDGQVIMRGDYDDHSLERYIANGLASAVGTDIDLKVDIFRSHIVESEEIVASPRISTFLSKRLETFPRIYRMSHVTSDCNE